MSSLALFTWNRAPLKLPQGDPDKACVAQTNIKYFCYDKKHSLTDHLNESNRNKVLQEYGLSKIAKKNALANNQVNAVDNNKNYGPKGKSLNTQRIEAIEKVDQEFADFFLRNLHNLTWKDWDTSPGILTTIDYQDAYDMLKLATKPYYELMLASVEDAYSKDLSLSNMKQVIEMHNLNNEYIIGQKK